MCGISGVFGRPDIETVKQMMGAIVHRGPDDGYSVAGTHFALGTRRLSIVGVVDGRQPLSNEDGTIWAAQNGELYNYPRVKPDLLRRGHRLQTHTDTEILVHLYEDFGTRLPEQIDGMFAIAVWDTVNKRGLLARDRMGKKPLYYYRDNDALYFASEIKSLLEVPGIVRRINLEALHHYLSFKHIPCPLSIFEGIHMLPPAHVLEFQLGEEPKIRRYWDLDFSPQSETANAPEEELVERLLALLRQGIERRLMSDVPIGFFLSGGIDSTLSTVLAAEISSTPIKTFTLRGIKDSPPYLHDGRLPTLADTVEFFNLALELKLSQQEKNALDVYVFLRTQLSGGKDAADAPGGAAAGAAAAAAAAPADDAKLDKLLVQSDPQFPHTLDGQSEAIPQRVLRRLE